MTQNKDWCSGSIASSFIPGRNPFLASGNLPGKSFSGAAWAFLLSKYFDHENDFGTLEFQSKDKTWTSWLKS